ncbi:hypothetical protein KX257_09180, partial [Escherichia coli]|nr:hypothetical protein [Escherichia coli]
MIDTGGSLFSITCFLYTSVAADEEDSFDYGGRRIVQKIHNLTSQLVARCHCLSLIPLLLLLFF